MHTLCLPILQCLIFKSGASELVWLVQFLLDHFSSSFQTKNHNQTQNLALLLRAHDRMSQAWLAYVDPDAPAVSSKIVLEDSPWSENSEKEFLLEVSRSQTNLRAIH